MRFYLKLGAERRKLVLGIPTYGRSFTLIDARFNGLQAAAQQAGTKGRNTNEDGYLSFYEVGHKFISPSTSRSCRQWLCRLAAGV